MTLEQVLEWGKRYSYPALILENKEKLKPGLEAWQALAHDARRLQMVERRIQYARKRGIAL